MRKLLSLCLSFILSASFLFSVGCNKKLDINESTSDNSSMSEDSSNDSSSIKEEINFDGWIGEKKEDCHLGNNYTVNVESIKASNDKLYDPTYTVVDSKGNAVEVADNQFVLRDLAGYKITYTIVVEDKTFTKVLTLNVTNTSEPIINHGEVNKGMVNRLYTMPDVVVTDIFDTPIENYTIKLYVKNLEELIEVPFETKKENEKTIRTFTPDTAGDYIITIEAEFAGVKGTKNIEFNISEPINFDGWIGEISEDVHLGDTYTLDIKAVTASNEEVFNPTYTVVDSKGEAVEVVENQFILRDVAGYKITYSILAYEETFTKTLTLNVINDAKPVINHTYPCDGVINKLYTLPDIEIKDVFGEPINEYVVKLFVKNGEELTEITYDETIQEEKTVRTFTPDALSFYVIKIEAEFMGNKGEKTLEFYVDNDNSQYEVNNFDNPYVSRDGIDFKFSPSKGTVEVEWLPEYEGKRGVLKVSYSDGGYINFAIKPKHERSVYEGSWQNFQVDIFAPEGENKLLEGGMQWADTFPTATWLDFGYGRWSKWVFGKGDRFLPNFDDMVNLNTASGKMFFKTENENGPGVFYIAGFYQLPMA